MSSRKLLKTAPENTRVLVKIPNSEQTYELPVTALATGTTYKQYMGIINVGPDDDASITFNTPLINTLGTTLYGSWINPNVYAINTGITLPPETIVKFNVNAGIVNDAITVRWFIVGSEITFGPFNFAGTNTQGLEAVLEIFIPI